MSTRLIGAAAVAVALLAAGAGSAQAAVVIYTFTGLASGYGGAGERFGFAGQSFNDQVFRLTFRRDDATPGASFYSNSNYSSITGSGSIAPITATLVFNGRMIDFGIGNAVGLQEQSDGSTEYFRLLSQHATLTTISETLGKISHNRVEITANGAGTDYLSSADFHYLTSLTPSATPSWNWQSIVDFSDTTYDLATFRAVSQADNGKIYLRPTSMTVGTSAVPELGTWALLVVGFGVAGAALRSQPRFHRQLVVRTTIEN